MSESVRALLSLWNDIAPERIIEYERWHSIEHVPERVWVPGFVAGTRYVAQGAGPRYFTLYELEQLDCLHGPAYQELVDQPTPWSASMRPSFANFLRKTGPLVATAGVVLGETLCAVRMVWSPGQSPAADHWTAVAQALLAARFDGFVTRVRVQQVEAAGPQALRNVDAAPIGDEFLVFVEQASPAPLDAGTLTLAALASVGQRAPTWQQASTYRFASQVRHQDVAAAVRPAPRTDLMPH